jgi:hypothetical protein
LREAQAYRPGPPDGYWALLQRSRRATRWSIAQGQELGNAASRARPDVAHGPTAAVQLRTSFDARREAIAPRVRAQFDYSLPLKETPAMTNRTPRRVGDVQRAQCSGDEGRPRHRERVDRQGIKPRSATTGAARSARRVILRPARRGRRGPASVRQPGAGSWPDWLAPAADGRCA